MTKLTDVAKHKVQHLCIFGDPKSGKSELAASCASFFRRVLWISMDNGYEILFKLPKDQQEKIELIRLPDTKEFPVAIDTCLKLVSGKLQKICDLHGQCDCRTCSRDSSATWTSVDFGELQPDEVVVFDHISQAADSAMSLVTKGKPIEYKPEWHDYAYQGQLMNKFLMNIQQAPYNCICISHTCETEMEDGSKKLVPLVGTVPFSRNAGKYFDHIIYCRVSNKKHNFGSATTYIASVLTGSRSDIVLEQQVAGRPTLEPFFAGHREIMARSQLLPDAKIILEKVTQEVVGEEFGEIIGETTVVGEKMPEPPEGSITPSASPLLQATEVEATKEMSASEKAKERLRLLREGKKTT